MRTIPKKTACLSSIIFSLHAFSLFSATVSDTNIDGTNGLRNAILNVNSGSSTTINFTVSGSLSSTSGYNLPPLDVSPNTITITGNGINFDGSVLTPAVGAPPFRGLFINSGTVTISNMNFANLVAQGGNGGTGGGGGGGGMGAGGAIFLNQNTTLNLNSCTFANNQAVGGNGGNGDITGFSGGGGGGLGGDGGNALTGSSTATGGGGGGLFGNGGSQSFVGGAGGGGLLGNGGIDPGNGPGGGGGGTSIPTAGNGTNSVNSTTPGTGGTSNGADGTVANCGSPLAGNAGGSGGGGGGGGGCTTAVSTGGDGGTGGPFGGGGSAGVGVTTGQSGGAGSGGLFGGGAGGTLQPNSNASTLQNGADAAFGGGGGGAGTDQTVNLSGNGGFGGSTGGAGGGGFSTVASSGFGGFGNHLGGNGGNGDSGIPGTGAGGGGGGGAAGGSIFINNANLILGTGNSFTGAGPSTLVPGNGGSGSGVGAPGSIGHTGGLYIFFNGGMMTCQNTDTLALTGVNGVATFVMNSGITMNGTGTLQIQANSNLRTAYTLNSGIIAASSQGSLGDNSGEALFFNGGTLELLSGFTTCNREIDLSSGGGTIIVDSGVTATWTGKVTDGPIGVGSLTIDGQGLFAFPAFSPNNYTGETILKGGTLQLNGTNAIDASQDINFQGGTLEINTVPTVDEPFILTTTGTILVSGGPTTLTGMISGSGTITKTGSQTLILATANTYTGETFLSQGTLALSGSGTVGTGPLNLNTMTTFDISAASGGVTTGGISSSFSDSTITLGSNDLTANCVGSYTYGGGMTGTGTFFKSGSGTLTISGTIAPMAVQVSSGRLSVDGTINVPITVSSGAILGGIGTVQDVNVFGSIAPGDSIGQITGNSFTFNSGSAYDVEISPSLSDFIQANATVFINPTGTTLSVSPDSGTYVTGTSYHIIHANSGITNQFASVVSLAPRLTFQTMYTPNDLFLIYTGMTAPFTTFVTTGNAGAAAEAFGTLDPSNPGVLALINFLNTASTDQLQCDFDAMQPALFNAIPITQESTSTAVRMTLTDRLQQIHGTLCEREMFQQNTLGLWLTPLGNFTKQHSRSQNEGCDNTKIGFHGRSFGTALGFDGKATDHFLLGGSVAYAHTDLHWKDSAAKSRTNSVFGSLFASLFNRYVYFDLAVMGGYDHFDAQRKMTLTNLTSSMELKAKHDNNAGEFDLFAGLGYTYNANKWQLGPFVQFDYLYMHQTGYKESGANVIDLKVRNRHSNLLRSEVGVSFSYCSKDKARPVKRRLPRPKKRKWEIAETLSLSYVHESRYKGKTTTSEFFGPPSSVPFDVEGFWPDRDLFSPGASIIVLFPYNHFSFELRYNGEFGKHWSNQTGSAEFLYSF